MSLADEDDVAHALRERDVGLSVAVEVSDLSPHERDSRPPKQCGATSMPDHEETTDSMLVAFLVLYAG